MAGLHDFSPIYAKLDRASNDEFSVEFLFWFFSQYKNQIWKKYKSLKIISFELMHPYNTLNVP